MLTKAKVGVAVGALLSIAASVFDVEVPADFAAALTTLIMGVAFYGTRERQVNIDRLRGVK